MGSLRALDEKTARKKGMIAAAATGGAVALIAASLPVLGVLALVPAAYLGYDWFMYRAKRGMRF
jgi:uncharacterized membrane protein